MRQAELFYEMKASLGEGPVYHTESNSLFWTDILKQQLHCYSFKNETLQSFQTDKYIGAFAFYDEKTMLVAADDGFSFLNLESETFTFISDPERDIPNNRFNDGKCDAKGRFWAGTMEFNPNSPNGSLYKLDNEQKASKMASEIIIANGLAWNKDQTKMYHVDSGKNEVHEYEFHLEEGTIQNKKLLYTFAESYGTPDGIAIDSNDCLYIAIWGGAKVVQFNPATSEILEEIYVPAPNVTSVTFGGEDFTTLFITTARDGLSDEQLKQYPLSGSVFKATTQVAGIPLNSYQTN